MADWTVLGPLISWFLTLGQVPSHARCSLERTERETHHTPKWRVVLDGGRSCFSCVLASASLLRMCSIHNPISNEVGSPAEVKHTTKRRTRN